jgi:hypothetical protein
MIRPNSEMYNRVAELARERAEWLPILEAACAEAEETEPYGGRFAGRWVLQRAAGAIGGPVWAPGLRLLVGYGLMQKDGESRRGGRRAYYRMTEWREVKEALSLLKALGSSLAAGAQKPRLR